MSRLTNGLLLAGMVRHRALRFSGLLIRAHIRLLLSLRLAGFTARIRALLARTTILILRGFDLGWISHRSRG
jgi:hypothetical protein